MLYHTLCGKDPDWIRGETERGVLSLKGRIPLYSGILIGQLSGDDLALALEAALAGGANGVAVFHAAAMTEAHRETFRRIAGSGRD